MLSGFDGLRFSHWHPEIRDDGVVVLSLDRQDSSVNAMSQDVLLEPDGAIEPPMDGLRASSSQHHPPRPSAGF
ncbi:hypothetical protein VM57_14535 [Stenotrophomonas maltophilia]|uniref:Uncharacterized protein n=1 Tax=Stenotrophomonas maltophilia TaxID=40324 RepID=A0A0F5ZNX0_STEMA|nr:hypothetical protein VM57_14535 [Stenotrophomonas maltophilia]